MREPSVGETGGEGVTAYLCSIITSALAHTHRGCSDPRTAVAVLEGPEVLARLGGCAPGLQVAPVGRKSLFCFRGSQLDVCVLIEETRRRFRGEG